MEFNHFHLPLNIKIENLSFRYNRHSEIGTAVLEDINLSVRAGELVAIIGLSGSGKTTLLQHMTGLLQPDSGRVLVDGKDIHSKNVSLSQLRRRLGLVFQFPETQLFAETVFDDIAFGPQNLGLDASQVASRVNAALLTVALNPPDFIDRSPFQLSSGEKRRVAIAGVLAMNPECLALDEPTAALDSTGILAISHFLKAFHASGKTVILVSHNIDLIARLATRVVVLRAGQLCYDGDVETLLCHQDILQQAGFALPRARCVVNYLVELGLANKRNLISVEQIKLHLTEIATTVSKQSIG